MGVCPLFPHQEAPVLEKADHPPDLTRADWTYELVGPKVQGNPYGLDRHFLRPHGYDLTEGLSAPTDFDGIAAWLGSKAHEGVVWWRDLNDIDCDKVKIKRRDFGLPWPLAD